MTDEANDANDATTRHEQPRRTNEGRCFGSISYAAGDEEQIEDLRRRVSVPVPAEDTGEHWINRPSRSTGGRKRLSG